MERFRNYCKLESNDKIDKTKTLTYGDIRTLIQLYKLYDTPAGCEWFSVYFKEVLDNTSAPDDTPIILKAKS